MVSPVLGEWCVSDVQRGLAPLRFVRPVIR
jgi:hypothetical protein